MLFRAIRSNNSGPPSFILIYRGPCDEAAGRDELHCNDVTLAGEILRERFVTYVLVWCRSVAVGACVIVGLL